MFGEAAIVMSSFEVARASRPWNHAQDARATSFTTVSEDYQIEKFLSSDPLDII